MARRKWKNRGLGSSSEVHSERGRSAIEGAVRAARDAVIAAKTDGDCKQARRWLRSASGWFGHAVAHSHSGGSGLALTPVSETIDRAAEAVDLYCPSRKPRRARATAGLGSLSTKRPYARAVTAEVGDFDMKFGLGLGLGIIVAGVVLKRLIGSKPTNPQIAAR